MRNKTSPLSDVAFWLCGAFLFSATAVHAQDNFGSGPNAFTIPFVSVGNAGNMNDAGAGGGSYSSPYGGVGYRYRISTYAISQNDITNAAASGLSNVTAGAHTGNRPAANITWYEAAAFVNWMNTSNNHQAAYDLTFSGGWSMNMWDVSEQASTGVNAGTNPYRHKEAYYFLPSEDEWYKAAYHQNDGATANYWDYATGGNTVPASVASGTSPGTAVYIGQSSPSDVTQAGGLSPYGTMGQNSNTYEWMESAFDGANTDPTKFRTLRGALWNGGESFIRSSSRDGTIPGGDGTFIGFRVASIPEPTTALLLLTGLGGLFGLRKRLNGLCPH